MCTKTILVKGIHLHLLKEKEGLAMLCFRVNCSFKIGSCFELPSGKKNTDCTGGRERPTPEFGGVNAPCYCQIFS